MIFVDSNQLILSSFFSQHGKEMATVDLFRHMFLNSLRALRTKYKSTTFGELVLCFDGPGYWRREVFPHYKSKRKETRDKSSQDWTAVFEGLDQLRNEMIEHFPYKVMHLTGVESDDSIAVLCKNVEGRHLIYSSDRDFLQLQKYPQVSQVSPLTKTAMTVKAVPGVAMTLIEHIIRGDSGDGIPNVFSDADAFVTGKRQKPVTAKKISAVLSENDASPLVVPPPSVKERWLQNRQLIDFDCIPEEIEARIMEHWNEQTIKGDRRDLLNYFIKHRLRELMSSIGDF